MKIKDFLKLKAVVIPNDDAALSLKDDVLVFVLPTSEYTNPDSGYSSCLIQELGTLRDSGSEVLEKDLMGYDISPEGMVTLLI